MSTSGTTTWKLNRNEIISAALRKLGVLSGGSSPETYQVTDGTQALNALVKGLETDGMPVWAIKSYTFTVTSGTAAYNIGVGKTLNTAKPLKVIQAWRNSGTQYSNVPMNVYTNYNYDILPLVNSSGTPVNLYYQPLREDGMINLWPKPNDSTTTITLRYQAPFEDMTGSTDDLDFPSEWTEAVIYLLASRLAPEYGIPLQDRQLLKKEADELHAAALMFGTEEGSLFFQPDTAGRKR
jgi:hypothetical protein